MKSISIHSWDFRIGVILYIVAWISLNDYWLCFVGGGLLIAGIFMILYWRERYNDGQQDEEKYQQRSKELVMVFMLAFGAISYKVAFMLIEMEQNKSEQQCGTVIEQHLKLPKSPFSSYIRFKTTQGIYKFKTNQNFSPRQFAVNDKICVKFIDQEKSLWLPNHYVLSVENVK